MRPFFLPDTIEALLRIAVIVPAIYLLIILFIRLSGKRSTSQMNNFDWIVTVALGSITASTILLKDITLAEGALSIALLLVLQYSLTFLARRSPLVARAVKAPPTLLLARGRFLDDAMATERISRKEVLAAVRKAGFTDLDQVDWIALENDASFSVIAHSDSRTNGNAIREIGGVPAERRH